MAVVLLEAGVVVGGGVDHVEAFAGVACDQLDVAAAGLALADRADCTAVFAANDQMALGLLRAFGERGRSVPDQISVVGFDDIADAAYFTPPLTTVRQDFAEVGRRSVREALRQIRDHTNPATGTEFVPTRLIVRNSTAPPPA